MIDDQDLFPIAAIPAAPACRPYSTPAGMSGSPTVEAMVGALAARSES
jgi:hypothetical protein